MIRRVVLLTTSALTAAIVLGAGGASAEIVPACETGAFARGYDALKGHAPDAAFETYVEHAWLVHCNG